MMLVWHLPLWPLLEEGLVTCRVMLCYVAATLLFCNYVYEISIRTQEIAKYIVYMSVYMSPDHSSSM